MAWQAEAVEVAAPPFLEKERAAWLCERFRELGLEQVEIDASGNALGYYPSNSDARKAAECVLISAHIDTIFPPGPTIRTVINGDRLQAPGACDNGAGIAGLLAVAAALKAMRESRAGLLLERGILFAGNVGEEGDGDTCT